MTVRSEGDLIILEGDCFIADAEALARLLREPGRVVDVGGARRLHTAIIQAMLVFRPAVIGQTGNPAIDALLAGHFRPPIRA